MNTITITAIEEGTGKTAITVGLGLLAKREGLDVGYMKPKGTRLESHVGKVRDRDPLLAAEVLDIEADIADLEPIVYSPTFIQSVVRGKESSEELAERVSEAFGTVSADRDLMLVEGAGRLEQGAIISLTDPAIADRLAATTVLVAEFERLEDLDRIVRAADEFGDRLAGIIFNRVEDRAADILEQDGIPFLEARGTPVLGMIRQDRELAGVTVREIADQLGARTLTEAGADAFVDRFLVGAMGPGEAYRHFRRTRNAAVVTGADRSEIHSAAIEAAGVSCLIVTGSARPSQKILASAERNDLAVIAVGTDTLTTIERAETIVSGGRTHDATTVETMATHLERQVDVDRLLAR